jgi:ABC-type sugar transport system substrate-binding protein
MKLSRRSVVLGALTLPLMSSVAFAADKILASVPGLSFPFFVHMMNAFKAEIVKQGYEVLESDGQVSSPKQTADIEAAITQGVKGIVISPNEVDAMAPALQQAVEQRTGVHGVAAAGTALGRARNSRETAATRAWNAGVWRVSAVLG